MEIKRPFSEADWLATPLPVRQYIEMLEQSILHLTAAMAELKGRTEKIEEQVNRNSQNSNKPPSSDPPTRWVERILSLKETCRLKGKPSFPVLVDLVQAYFKDQQPGLAWIA
jgi:hypothetical protein